MTDVQAEQIFPAPPHACEPVQFVMRTLNEELARHDDETIFATYMAADHVASTCGRLCATGCIRDEYFAAEAAGTPLEPSVERDQFFQLVSDVLAIELLEDAAREPAAVYELDNIDSAGLEEIIESRLAIVQAQELLEQMSQVIGTDVDDLKKALDSLLTPRGEGYYDALADMVNGNIRAALYITSYLVGILPMFRSGDPEMMSDAASVRARGFWPANPFEISPLDIDRLKGMVDNNGFLEMPESRYSSMVIHLTEDPDQFKVFRRDHRGEIIDVSAGWLPAERGVIDVAIRDEQA